MTRVTNTTRVSAINLKRGGFVMSSVKRRIEEGFVEIAPSFVKGYCKGKKGFLKQIEDLQKQLNTK